MYAYVKGHEKRGRWKPVHVDDLPKTLESPHLGFSTVLMATEGPPSGTDMPEDAQYQGPFYIDIDDDSIKKAISKAKKVLRTLKGYGLRDDCMEIYATGKRGFHLLVPMRHFTVDQPLPNLSFVYKLMIMQMQIMDLVDDTVYSARKGRMWRITNRKRKDNGKFKVRITMAELEQMDEEAYDKLVSQPRDMPAGTSYIGTLTAFNGLFKASVKKAQSSHKPPPMYVDEELIAQLGDQLLPQCGMDMLNGSNIKRDMGFNNLSMQMAKAIAAFAPEHYRDLAKQFAENNTGTAYNTPSKRLDHLNRAYQAASRSSSYDWSCASAVTVLCEEPCLNCPLIRLKLAQLEGKSGIDEDDGSTLEAYAMPDSLSAPTTIKAPAPAPQPAVEHAPAAAPVSVPAGRRAPPVLSQPYVPVEAPAPAQAVSAPAPSAAQAGPGPLDVLQVYNPDTIAPPPRKVTVEHEPVGRRAPARPKREPKPKPEAEGEPAADSTPRVTVTVDGLEDVGAMGLMTSEEGYFFLGAHAPRFISNFTFQIEREYIEFIPNIGQDRRVAVEAKVIIQDRSIGTAILEESNWSSKSALVSTLHGLGHAAFFGKDDDIQKMKATLMQNVGTAGYVETVRRVRAVGIHHARVAGHDIFTYVEPGWSLDNLGNHNKYQLEGKVSAAPELKLIDMPEKGDCELTDALRAMMRTNAPSKVALMFSWYMACFLKTHMVSYNKEFPVLGVSGSKGSGKSKGNELYASLHGLEYYGQHSTVNLANVTPFVVWSTMSNTLSSPRILNEYNKSKLEVRHYKSIGELLKDNFEVGARQHGTIGGNKAHGGNGTGAYVTEFPLSAPCAVLSEQSVSMPALVERMVQVALSPMDLNIEGVRENFRMAQSLRPAFKRFAKLAYMKAIHLPIEKVRGWVESHKEEVPIELGDRPQICFCILLAGLDFFEEVCRDHEIDLIDDINVMRGNIADYLEEEYIELRASKNHTEVDDVLTAMGIMASVSPDDRNGIPNIVSDVHYYRDDKSLWLDGLMCHTLYKRYMRAMGTDQAVIDNYGQFRALIKTEPYCISVAATPPIGWTHHKPAIQLSIERLEARGLDLHGFVTSLEAP